MDRNELVTIAQRLREYVGSVHHIDPMSDAFKRLIGEASEALSQAAKPAPVAVALPERKKDVHQGLSHTDAKASGWNACLDEVRRLNQ